MTRNDRVAHWRNRVRWWKRMAWAEVLLVLWACVVVAGLANGLWIASLIAAVLLSIAIIKVRRSRLAGLQFAEECLDRALAESLDVFGAALRKHSSTRIVN